MGLFRKLFERQPRFDPAEGARVLLASLPPCTEHVVVGSPRYSGNYRCEVTVSSTFLAEKTRRDAESTFGGSSEQKIARIAMPMWLERASHPDGRTCYMPPSFVENIDVWVANFVRDGVARVYCPDCGAFVSDLEKSTRNQRTAGPWSEWTSSWRCRNGHLLYAEDHEVHILRGTES